jgi:hypothetical protein
MTHLKYSPRRAALVEVDTRSTRFSESHADIDDGPPTFSFAASYLDSVETVSDKRYPKETLDYFKANCGSIVLQPFPSGNGYFKFRLTLHQPNQAAIERLASEGRLATQVQIALDLVAASRYEAREMQAWMVRHIFMDQRVPEPITYYVKTTYFNFLKVKGPRRKLAIYSHRPSKPNPGLPCCHIEFRVAGVRNLNVLAIRTPTELLNLNHAHFWEDAIDIVQIPSAIKLGKRWLRYHLNRLPGRQLRIPYGRTSASVRVGELIRRAGPVDDDGRHVANQFAVYLASSVAFADECIQNLFDRMDTSWLIPAPGNALWEQGVWEKFRRDKGLA